MEENTNIFRQFAKAWGTIENPPLDATNPHFENRFASLKAINEVIRNACIPNGLVYHQAMRSDDTGHYFKSWVQNLDGEVLELSNGYIPMIEKSQPFGSDLTYRKRYLAQLDWGIIGEEDDDGEINAKTAFNPLSAARNLLVYAMKDCAEKTNCDYDKLVELLKNSDDYDKNDIGYLVSKTSWYLNGK